MPSAPRVSICSFSYPELGIPADESGHSGGFVFDCRFLPNPGREPEYAHLDGRDTQVVKYLERTEIVAKFLARVFDIIDMAVANYSDRGFENLMVCFGCTGGQHRSVYCAEKLAEHLKGKGVDIILHHLSLENPPA